MSPLVIPLEEEAVNVELVKPPIPQPQLRQKATFSTRKPVPIAIKESLI